MGGCQAPGVIEEQARILERAAATCFFFPPGEVRGSGKRGARVEIFGELAPSSDPSGHLLPGGEKNRATPARFI